MVSKKLWVLSVFAVSLSQSSMGAWLKVLDVPTPSEGTFRTDRDIPTNKLRVEKSGRDCQYTHMKYTALSRGGITVPLIPIGTTPTGGQIYNIYPANTTLTSFKVNTTQGHGDCNYRFLVNVPDLN